MDGDTIINSPARTTSIPEHFSPGHSKQPRKASPTPSCAARAYFAAVLAAGPLRESEENLYCERLSFGGRVRSLFLGHRIRRLDAHEAQLRVNRDFLDTYSDILLGLQKEATARFGQSFHRAMTEHE